MRTQGFTLIELLIVIAIIAILAVVLRGGCSGGCNGDADTSYKPSERDRAPVQRGAETQ